MRHARGRTKCCRAAAALAVDLRVDLQEPSRDADVSFRTRNMKRRPQASRVGDLVRSAPRQEQFYELYNRTQQKAASCYRSRNHVLG